jgi:CBS domain-containing protein
MPTGFDTTNPPFDRLTLPEMEELRAALDIAYFHPGEVVVRKGQPAEALFVVIKGTIEGRDGDVLHAMLRAKDSFDSRAVVHGAAGEDFVAAEETLCYLLPQAVVLSLIRRNPGFAAFFYAEISRKLDDFARQRPGGADSVLHSRVRDARFGPAILIDGGMTIEAAGHRMREHDINVLLVQDGDRQGVVTGMNLSKAVVLGRLPLDTPIRDACHFEIVAVDADDFLFDALLLMTRHGKRRIAVRSEGKYVGFLEDIDLLGLFAGNSQLIPGRIDRARSPEDLLGPARDIQAQVERLHRQGVKVDAIAEITSDLNRRLFTRLFDMLAPPSIKEAGCLLLMGSEGRGEQTVRTDQDNALLLSAEVPEAELAAFREGFTRALEGFGFPPCPGNVMVRNPHWSQPIKGFVRQLAAWVRARDPEAAMNIAIFCDASAVAGHAKLLVRARTALTEMLQGEAVLLARFANLVESFATPALGVLSTLMASVGVGSDEIDIKKAGTFPIVHGIRTLAVDKGVLASSTAARIEALVGIGSLEPAFGRELVSALHLFMEFRLRSQLEAMRRGASGAESLVHLGELTTVDRDILRDALRIVRQLRDILHNHYRLTGF